MRSICQRNYIRKVQINRYESSLKTARYWKKLNPLNRSNYPKQLLFTTMFETPIKQQRHVTYKRREVKIYKPMEETLMDELGLTYSDLVKKGVRNLWNQRQQEKALTLWALKHYHEYQWFITPCLKK